MATISHRNNDPKVNDPELENRLRKLLQDTQPAEPDELAWNNVLAHIECNLQVPQNSGVDPGQGRHWLIAAGAAAAAVLLGLWVSGIGSRSFPPSTSGFDQFPVATSSEIEILSVGGADTQTLVVGRPPLDGTIELLAPGDVTLFSVEPADDEMVPEIRFHGPNSPMIWAHLD